jgi:hypothetical protein
MTTSVTMPISRLLISSITGAPLNPVVRAFASVSCSRLPVPAESGSKSPGPP